MATDGPVEVRTHRIFADTFCKYIAFELKIPREEFRFAEFARAMGGERRHKFTNQCGSRLDSTDFHLHLKWDLRDDHDPLEIDVEFAPGHKKPQADEKEPYAEEFIAWLRQFVVSDRIEASVYSDFEFPVGYKSRFPLPLRAPIGPKESQAEIDGIAVRLSPPPRGVNRIWLSQSDGSTSVHLHAERTLQLSSFQPRSEIEEFSGVLESIVGSRSPGLEGNLQ